MRKQRLAFSRRELKMLAKRLMFHPICMRVTLLLVGLQVAFVGLRYLLGATLTYGVASLAQYGDTVSGIYFNSEGFSILFRMDLTQMVLAIPVTYAQLIRFVVFSVVVLLILAPIRLGVMEKYWSMLLSLIHILHTTQPGRAFPSEITRPSPCAMAVAAT